jgi:hypothetical protein
MGSGCRTTVASVDGVFKPPSLFVRPRIQRPAGNDSSREVRFPRCTSRSACLTVGCSRCSISTRLARTPPDRRPFESYAPPYGIYLLACEVKVKEPLELIDGSLLMRRACASRAVRVVDTQADAYNWDECRSRAHPNAVEVVQVLSETNFHWKANIVCD